MLILKKKHYLNKKGTCFTMKRIFRKDINKHFPINKHMPNILFTSPTFMKLIFKESEIGIPEADIT